MIINTKTIRQSVVDRLLNNTAAGANVFNSKVTPAMAKNLPAVMVYTPNQRAESFDPREHGVRRDLDIQIEVLAKGTTNWADAVDDIMFEIKMVLLTDPTWREQFVSVAGYTELQELSSEGEEPIAMGVLTIQVEIFEALENAS